MLFLMVATTHIVRTPASAASLDIRFDLSELKTGGDIAFVYVSVLDANGTVVSNASNLISLNIISGPATLVSPNQVQAEAGIATFLLRSTTEPGLITVQATASTLSSDTATIISR
jgi:beta-galactosidase